MNPFAAAACFVDPARERYIPRRRESALLLMARQGVDSDCVLRLGTAPRAVYGTFWCDVVEVAAYENDGRLDEGAEFRLEQLLMLLQQRQSCKQAHAEFFRFLMFAFDSRLDGCFETFWAKGGAFSLPNDARAVTVATQSLSTLVWMAGHGYVDAARTAMAKHLRQLHYRPVL